MIYKINSFFYSSSNLEINNCDIKNTVFQTNDFLKGLPINLYKILDLKTSSSIVGAIFCSFLIQNIQGAIINPIEKGHPDILPCMAKNASEEELRNYPEGIEIKTTIGNIRYGKKLNVGKNRLSELIKITWQAHHQEVTKLMGLIWDFNNLNDDFNFPMITGVFYSELTKSDWGSISGIKGRNTKVCSMILSGHKKMKKGWIMIHEKYFKKYNQLLDNKVSCFSSNLEE